jgi:hypothetical protein
VVASSPSPGLKTSVYLQNCGKCLKTIENLPQESRSY